MHKVGEESGQEIGNKTIKPKEFVGAEDDASEEGVDDEVYDGKDDANDSEFQRAGFGFWFCHTYIIARRGEPWWCGIIKE